MRRQAAFLLSGGVFVVAFAALVALGTWLRGPAPIQAALTPRQRRRLLMLRTRQMTPSVRH
jgi:hypothetical protein